MLSRIPLVLAPMAGGPSTPALCAAVSNAGATGSLAAGYLSPEQLREQAEETASLSRGTWGINLFVPERHDAPQGESLDQTDRDAWDRYRTDLAQDPHCAAAQLPDSPHFSDDHYAEKLAYCAHSPATFISFTFGYPSPEEVELLRSSGKRIVLSATTVAGVRAAEAAGADYIVIQGLEAGGHRAGAPVADDPANEAPTRRLLHDARAATTVPLFAAGGVGSRSDVVELRDAGAAAVQVGTLFLTAAEAGTKPTHRRALLTLRDRETVLTTAFTGKRARAIRNTFIELHDTEAPPLYPQVHYLTAPLRAEANKQGDAEYLNLWAGTGFPHANEEPAADIVHRLAP